MPSAIDVAKYFLALADPDAGDLISNLKIQKLAYYAQGFHLAILGRPLFHEPIEAWTYGPVVPALWREYRQYGDNAIPMPEGFNMAVIPDASRDLLDEVYKVFGQFSAWKLRNMTHDEPPWRDTPRNCVISHQALFDYFTTQVVDE